MRRSRSAGLRVWPSGQPRPLLSALRLVILLPGLLAVAVAPAAEQATGKKPPAATADKAQDKKPPAAPAPNKAQEKKPPAAAAAGQAKKDDKEKPPPPQEITLSTSDGVQIAATYLPGTKGKESVPVVLLHMLKGGRKDYTDLALYLQSQGLAVLVPDLRGHGDSAVRGGSRGPSLDVAKLSAQQFGLMAKLDMKAVRDYLWARNNAGELNLNKLCLVGAEMGAGVAVDFSVYDAAGYGEGNPPGNPYYGPLQLGQFVKALVLLSPEWSFKGLPITEAKKSPAVLGQVAVMILVGAENHKALADAKRIHGIFKPHHPDPEGDNKLERKTLFLGTLDTSLQGTKLLEAKELHVRDNIAQFIYLRLVKSAEANSWAWKELKRPHQ